MKHSEETEMLKEKEQLEETRREMQDLLHEFDKKNSDLEVFYNEEKEKNIGFEQEKQLETKCTEIECSTQEMVTKNTHLQ